MLEVDHPTALPRLVLRADAVTRPVAEADRAPLAEDRLDLGGAGVAVVDEAAVERVEVRRTDEERPGRAVAQVVLPAEGGLATEGPQALPEDVEPRPVVPRERAPAFVDGVEQRASGGPGAVLVDEERQPRGQVGVLHGDRGRVAAGDVLEGAQRRRLHPAGARRGHHEQLGAVEAARPLEVVDGQGGPLLDVLGAGDAGVDPDRVLGGLPGEGGDVVGGRPASHEDATLATQVLPRHDRVRAAGTQGSGRLRHLPRCALVAQRVDAVGGPDRRVEQHPVDQQHGDPDQQHQSRRPGRALAHAFREQAREPPVRRPYGAREPDQEHERHPRHQRDEEGGRRVLRLDRDELADLSLPEQADTDRRQRQDRSRHEEGAPVAPGRRPGPAVGVLPPHPGRQRAEPVADRGGDARDQALVGRRSRQQAGQEAEAAQDQRDPGARQVVAKSSSDPRHPLMMSVFPPPAPVPTVTRRRLRRRHARRDRRRPRSASRACRSAARR